MIVCLLQKFEMREPDRFPGRVRIAINLADLPDHYDVLNFLASPNVEPVLAAHQRHMTTQAAEKVALAYHSLDRGTNQIRPFQYRRVKGNTV